MPNRGTAHRHTASNTTDTRSDAELIAAVRAECEGAFSELWRRHKDAARRLAKQVGRPSDADELVSESFYRVLQALKSGGGPDAAFRPYLFTTLRRVAIDLGRKQYQRIVLTDDVQQLESAPAAAAETLVLENSEASLAWRAWSSLPEQERTLLWHTVIEGEAPAIVARLLSISPNAVSSRALRARERLREAFLREQLHDADNEACLMVRGLLGRYIRGGLATRDLATVEAHLDDCAGCRNGAAEVRDVNRTMRTAIAPGILGAVGSGRYVKAAHLSNSLVRKAAAVHSHLVLAAGTGVAASVGAAVVIASSGGPARHDYAPPSAETTSKVRPSLGSASPAAVPPVSPPRQLAAPTVQTSVQTSAQPGAQPGARPGVRPTTGPSPSSTASVAAPPTPAGTTFVPNGTTVAWSADGEPGFPASNVTDGNPDTCWRSTTEQGGENLMLKLKFARPVTSITYVPCKGDAGSATFYSMAIDGVGSVGNGYWVPDQAAKTTVSFAPTQTIIFDLSNEAGQYVSAAEIVGRS